MDEHQVGTLTVGIDWGSTTHQVCVLDASGHRRGERAVSHTGEALAALASWLVTLGEVDPARIHVAIEVPRGPIVESLLERGFGVWVINPKQVDRFRDRYTMAGAKDDRRDAHVLAWALRTDPQAFRLLGTESPQVIALREWSRLDTELGEELRRTANRLRDLLHRFYPQVLQLCPAADEPWIWALLAVVPTPDAAQRVRRAVITRVLKAAHIRRVTAETVWTTLRTPAVVVAPGTVAAVSAHVALLLPRLVLLHTQRTATEKHLKVLLTDVADTPGPEREHHDVTILLSLPGVGVRVAAAMLAEGAEPLRRRDYHALRALSGLAPVTQASGKSRTVTMRHACQAHLRLACYHLARNAVRRDAHAKAHYATLRGRGHTHARALRGVADRHLAVLVAMLASGTLYAADRRPPVGQAA
jgi:transposase